MTAPAIPTAPILIAGAGIGGLTAALALARRGFTVAVFEQAAQLEEAGAGIQLSPNATRILIALGLGERLASVAFAPAAIRLRTARTGRILAAIPLGAAIEARYGAPYWLLHRADLQHALLEAVAAEPRITVALDAKICDFVVDAAGVAASFASGTSRRGTALICADGIWSGLRERLGNPTSPRISARVAWRAMVPTAALRVAAHDARHPPDSAAVELWLGPGGHIVHYPVQAGAATNIVAVAPDLAVRSGADHGPRDAVRDEVLARFPARAWAPAVRDLLAAAERWQQWAICDGAPPPRRRRGPATLLGDAAHPMLPYLAQGAAMAIEDAAVLADAMARLPAEAALRAYEALRRRRTARVQRAARRNDLGYHLRGPAAVIRNGLIGMLGGKRLLAQYDWIYRWRP